MYYENHYSAKIIQESNINKRSHSQHRTRAGMRTRQSS